MATTTPTPIRCPRCGAPGVWHAQMMQWGCDHCRQMIGGSPQAPAPFAGAIPPGPVAPPSVPSCPRCWAPGTWHAQVGKWGCDRCQSTFDPPVIAGASAGAKVAKFFLWMILLIVVIAIKVALRRRW